MTPIVSDLFLSVTPIRTRRENGQGTGFFYRKNNHIYLITNRHVIVDERDSYFPTSIDIKIHTNPSDLRQNQIISIQLYNDNNIPYWLEHPDLIIDDYGNPIPDIVAIPLQDVTNWAIRPFSNNDFGPNDLIVLPGEDLIVLGYPHGFYDELFNLPIIRKASIASAYGVPFRGHPFFVIDAKLHPGTSGSPVLTKPTNIFVRKSGTHIRSVPVAFLLGIHSASFEPLELNVVYYSYLIEEIILSNCRGRLRT